MKHYGTTKSTAKPDMTPLLDIVFIMLIFFIVTATFVREEGVTITRQNHTVPMTEAAPRTLQIHIAADRHFYESGHMIDIWATEALIKRFHTENPKLPILLKLDHDAPMQNMLRVYDAGRKAGLRPEKMIVL